ncbi:MAG: arginase family protein [Chthoniobacterales bacterium]
MSAEDPNWPRASHWLAQRTTPSQLDVVSVPLNSSITPGRCDLAPAAIRHALERYSLYDPDSDVDLAGLTVWDRGDVAPTAEAIRDTCGDVATVLLGGDNGITLPGVQAMGLPLARCGVLTFDAHHDLRDLDRGLTNGTPIRALLRDGLPGANVVQVGIQPFTNSAAYAHVAREAGVRVVTADQVRERGIELVVRDALDSLANHVDAIYVDLDVDVLDRAFSPACPGSRPGGLEPWMLRRAARLCGAHPKIRILDIVEVDPTKDIADATCLAAASFLLAFAAGVASRARP